MYDWLQKHGNFNQDYLNSVFLTEGYFDHYSFSTVSKNDLPKLISYRREGFEENDGKYTYEFIFIPNAGFLNNNQPLPPGCELKLTFDRIEADCSVLRVGETNPLSGTTLELKNVTAQATYISSSALRNYFDQIDERPISYKYEDCSVVVRNLPINEQTIRLDNLFGGMHI